VYPMVARALRCTIYSTSSPIVETAPRMSSHMMNTFVCTWKTNQASDAGASLFRRRAFNIDSLTVGRTEKPESRA